MSDALITYDDIVMIANACLTHIQQTFPHRGINTASAEVGLAMLVTNIAVFMGYGEPELTQTRSIQFAQQDGTRFSTKGCKTGKDIFYLHNYLYALVGNEQGQWIIPDGRTCDIIELNPDWQYPQDEQEDILYEKTATITSSNLDQRPQLSQRAFIMWDPKPNNTTKNPNNN